jgi:hypothetical protein
MPLLPFVQMATYLNLPSSGQPSAHDGGRREWWPAAGRSAIFFRAGLQKLAKEDIMTSGMEFYTLLLQFFRPLRIAYPADLIKIKPFFLFWRAGTTPPMENHRSNGVVVLTPILP